MTDRKVTFEITKDGGHNWGNRKERSLGELGEYRLVTMRMERGDRP